jgi:hypothetical protein
MSKISSNAARLIAVAAALALGLGAAVPAAQAAQGHKPAKKQKPQQVHPTGEEDAKAPTAEEAAGEAALEQMTNRSSEGLAVVQHENGMASVDLEGRFMSVMVAATRKDGTRGAVCSHDHDQVSRARKAATEPAVAAPAPPAPKTAPVLEEK